MCPEVNMICGCDPEIRKKINDLHKEVYGNGNSSNSMVTRIARLETNVKMLTSISVSQFFLLIGVAIKMFLGA